MGLFIGLVALFLFYFYFSLSVSVYVYVSLCDFVCSVLLLPCVLGFCLFVSCFCFCFCFFLFVNVYVYVSLCDFCLFSFAFTICFGVQSVLFFPSFSSMLCSW